MNEIAISIPKIKNAVINLNSFIIMGNKKVVVNIPIKVAFDANPILFLLHNSVVYLNLIPVKATDLIKTNTSRVHAILI